ncbi:MAG: hypothetical protein ACI4QJ_08705 [Candidatus Spyradenecus sp.]
MRSTLLSLGLVLCLLSGCYGPIRTATIGEKEFATLTWAKANPPWATPMTATGGALMDTVTFALDTTVVLTSNIAVRPLIETYPEPLWPQIPALGAYIISPVTVAVSPLFLRNQGSFGPYGLEDYKHRKAREDAALANFVKCWKPFPLIGMPYHGYKIACSWDKYNTILGRHIPGPSYALGNFMEEDNALANACAALRAELQRQKTLQAFQAVIDKHQDLYTRIQAHLRVYEENKAVFEKERSKQHKLFAMREEIREVLPYFNAKTPADLNNRRLLMLQFLLQSLSQGPSTTWDKKQVAQAEALIVATKTGLCALEETHRQAVEKLIYSPAINHEAAALLTSKLHDSAFQQQGLLRLARQGENYRGPAVYEFQQQGVLPLARQNDPSGALLAALKLLLPAVKNQSHLYDFLIAAEAPASYPIALPYITDKNLQAKLLHPSTPAALRNAAAQYLPNCEKQLLLKSIVAGNLSAETIHQLLPRFSSDEELTRLLTSPVISEADAQTCLNRVTNVETLVDVVKHSPRLFVLRAAIKKLAAHPAQLQQAAINFARRTDVQDSNQLYDLANAFIAANPECVNLFIEQARQEKVLSAAVEHCEEQALLVKAFNRSLPPEMRSWVLTQITDEALIPALDGLTIEEAKELLNRCHTRPARNHLWAEIACKSDPIKEPDALEKLAWRFSDEFDDLCAIIDHIPLAASSPEDWSWNGRWRYVNWSNTTLADVLVMGIFAPSSLNPSIAAAIALSERLELSRLSVETLMRIRYRSQRGDLQLPEEILKRCDARVATLRAEAVKRVPMKQKEEILILRGLYLGMSMTDFGLLAPEEDLFCGSHSQKITDEGIDVQEKDGCVTSISWSADARRRFFGWTDEEFLDNFATKFRFPPFKQTIVDRRSVAISYAKRWRIKATYYLDARSLVIERQ